MEIAMSRINRLILMIFSSVCFMSVGCAEGPFGGFAAVNPWMHKKWAEDEKFGPTFHRRLADLRGLRSGAARLEPAKKEEIAADMIRLLATEPNPVLRGEMVTVLGELGIPSVLPGLQTALNDTDRDVRIAACRAWGKAGNEAIPVLSELLERETEVDVRLAVIQELGRFPHEAAVTALGRALDDNDPAVQHLAVQSLKQSTGKELGDSVPAWRDYVQGREPQAPTSPSIVERITNWF
jgi:hypothetical protein